MIIDGERGAFSNPIPDKTPLKPTWPNVFQHQLVYFLGKQPLIQTAVILCLFNWNNVLYC